MVGKFLLGIFELVKESLWLDTGTLPAFLAADVAYTVYLYGWTELPVANTELRDEKIAKGGVGGPKVTL